MINEAQDTTNLSPEKRRLLLKQLLEQKARGPKTFPLSFTQEGLWFLNQLAPDNIVYNVWRATRIRGALNIEALRQALETIVSRHDTLRTSFVSVNGSPMQVIAKNVAIDMPIVDLSDEPAASREDEAMRFATEEARRLFDLSQGPLLRITLLKLGEEEHILLIVMHHIVSDDWSKGVMFRELSALYKAFSAGKPSPLAELPIQYADFAVWQRQWLQEKAADEQLSYWKKQLSGVPDIHQLPIDRPRPTIQAFRGARQSYTLSTSLAEKLKTLSRGEEVTLFMTLLAAYKILLFRHSNQEDIVVGTPSASRNRSEIEGLIGYFLNMLVLRTDHSGDPTFRTLLKRVREVCLGAYAHQDLPFDKLVEELRPGRHLSHHPIFQVAFIFHNALLHNLDLPGLECRPVWIDAKRSVFDMTVVVFNEPEGLKLVFEYNTDLFDDSTIERMIGHYVTLLEGIAHNPDTPISQLPLLTEAERHQLLIEWNDTASNYPKEQCIHQLFEAQAERVPDKTAVIFENQQLTYQQLNERANQLAHHLKKHGVGPDVLVGICMDRSLEMMVGLLGILKAGGGYVPLDPTYPPERLAFMLEDSQVAVLLTQDQLLQSLPKHGAEVICIDTMWPTIGQECAENSPSQATPEELAYVIYTSGSTGKPKGVQIPHRALTNFLSTMQDHLELTKQDILFAVTTLSFDIAALELYLPIVIGACVEVVSRDVSTDGALLAERIETSEATVMQATPATWRLLIEADWKGSDQLKVLSGGEALSRKLADQLLKRAPCVWNLYGPTETTIWSASYKVEPAAGSVSIGRPIGNTQIYILDQHLQLTPVGVPGELHIGGDGLARGYLNRPELTKEKFIPDPFSQQPEARLYKTGDLVRYLPDGKIEFLGRIDHQVKVRGHRIELGEIEAVLRQYSLVRESVVITRERIAGDKHLEAYIVSDQQQEFSVNQLRNFLRDKLPGYMIPSAFVLLDKLPLTPNGKVDRRALPAPEAVGHYAQETYIAPRDELELQLTKIWENVLNVQPIGIQDDFFELGGHSLLAVRLFAQLEKVFGKNLPLATLFQAPTIEQLSEILRDEGWKAPWASLVPIQPQGSKPPLFCVHAVGGNVLSLRDLARHLGLDQPFYALQSQGLDGKERPPVRVEDMAAYYIEEMRTVQPEGPYYLSGQSSGGLVAFEMAQQLQAQGEKVAILVLIDTHIPIDRRLSVTIPLRNKISFHRHAFSQHGSTYVLEWIRYRVKDMKFQLERNGAEIVKKIYKSLERPLPQSVRYTYVREVIRQAVRNYTPQSYPGRITLFRATNTLQAYLEEDTQRSQRGWNGLATEGLETYDIPGAHNLEQEPYVGILAKKLGSCIHDARVIVSQQKVALDSSDLDGNYNRGQQHDYHQNTFTN